MPLKDRIDHIDSIDDLVSGVNPVNAVNSVTTHVNSPAGPPQVRSFLLFALAFARPFR
jgi:hypothetical protein